MLRRLDEAYRRFFAKAGGFPSFKRRGGEPGLRFPDPKQFAMDAANGRIKLPKLGWVRLRLSQSVEGGLRHVSITREGSKWFASNAHPVFAVEDLRIKNMSASASAAGTVAAPVPVCRTALSG